MNYLEQYINHLESTKRYVCITDGDTSDIYTTDHDIRIATVWLNAVHNKLVLYICSDVGFDVKDLLSNFNFFGVDIDVESLNFIPSSQLKHIFDSHIEEINLDFWDLRYSTREVKDFMKNSLPEEILLYCSITGCKLNLEYDSTLDRDTFRYHYYDFEDDFDIFNDD